MRRMTRFLIVGVLAAALGLGLYTHNLRDQMLDGDYTYVDNNALLSRITGSWESADGRFRLLLREDSSFSMALEGETVLEGELQFTYLQPGAPRQTELTPEPNALTHAEGTAFARVSSLMYVPGKEMDLLRMKLAPAAGSTGGNTGLIEFCRTGDLPAGDVPQ